MITFLYLAYVNLQKSLKVNRVLSDHTGVLIIMTLSRTLSKPLGVPLKSQMTLIQPGVFLRASLHPSAMLMHLSNRLKFPTINYHDHSEYLACRIDLIHTRSRAQKSFSDADWLAYRNLRNKINNLATRLKHEFIETSISNAGTDTQKLWKTIKTALPGSKHDVNSSLRDGDSITNDGKLIADNVNIFFSTI